MKNTNIAKGNTFPNKMKVNLNMLGSLMLDGVLGHVDGADIVTIHESRLVQRSVKLGQELSQPGGLSDCIGDGPVLSFSAGA
jgi:hypothetical protein